MEKKTIGKFISALRRANGMTQRELGDKLYVSDKTVSRWERDECTPELHLIPAIAEIFGITTDELLRGERQKTDTESEPLTEAKGTQKSEKQFKLMLHKRLVKYKNLTLISYGISFIGFIIAMIFNLALSEGLIAFCIATAFIIAGEICQTCFAVSARLIADEDEEAYRDKTDEANTGIIKSVIALSFVNLSIFAFCLPLVTLIDGANYGLSFKSWLTYGALFAVIAFAIAYIIYKLFIQKLLIRNAVLLFSKDEIQRIDKNNKLLKKCLATSLSVAAVLSVAIFTLNLIGAEGLAKKDVLKTPLEFKEYMESDFDEWAKHGTTYFDKWGNVIANPEIDIIYPDYIYGESKKVFDTLTDGEGNILCEYYYNPDLYREISYSDTNDKMPAKVITTDAYQVAVNMLSDLSGVLYFLISVNFIITIAIYIVKLQKPTRKLK